MKTASGRHNIVILETETVSCSTRAMTTSCFPSLNHYFKSGGNERELILSSFTDEEGNTKLRNTSHMKTFIQPDLSTEGTEDFRGGGETENMPTGKELETTALTPPINIDKQPTPPPESNGSALPSWTIYIRKARDLI